MLVVPTRLRRAATLTALRGPVHAISIKIAIQTFMLLMDHDLPCPPQADEMFEVSRQADYCFFAFSKRALTAVQLTVFHQAAR